MKKLRLLILLLSIFTSLQLSAQMEQKENHFIGLLVANLYSSTIWYRDKLGFNIIDQTKNDNTKAKFALLSWNGILIEMIEHPGMVTNSQIKEIKPENIGNQGFFKLGFYIENLESFQAELKSKGVKIAYPILKAEGFKRKLKLFIINDNEGNLIQFYNFSN